MKLAKLLPALLLLIALTACSPGKDTNASALPDSDASNSNTWELHAHQSLSATTSQKFLSANVGMTVDLPEVGLQKVVARREAEGHVTDFDKFPLSVHILSDYRYRQPALHDSYLAVEIENGMLYLDLENSSYEDDLYLCDVDGDGLDEIVVQQQVDSNGGAGQFVSRVFRVSENTIKEIFASSTGISFETGFTSEYLDGYRLKITNTITGYSATMDIATQIPSKL
jgi:hypothetical protein